jgi:hypothetical protein
MVNGYLSAGDIAPQILFFNGPAANAYTSARISLYSISATPTFKIDGVNSQAGWNQTIVQNYINARLSVPSVISITADFYGNSSGGTANYAITAESDPGVTGLKVWSAIVEDHDIASSAYGVYNAQELMWEPRAFPLGATGTAISFTGPYPQTVNFSQPYTLNPAEHNFDNLDVVTYVQASAGTREVLNASFIDLPTTATGVYENEADQIASCSVLGAWPNPASGAFAVSSFVPQGTTGTVEIFDITGRSVEHFEAGSIQNMNIEEAGVYFIRLTTSSGEVVCRQVAVVR